MWFSGIRLGVRVLRLSRIFPSACFEFYASNAVMFYLIFIHFFIHSTQPETKRNLALIYYWIIIEEENPILTSLFVSLFSFFCLIALHFA